MADELILPPFPNVFEYAWGVFLDVHRGRSYGMNGAEPFSWADIHAWCKVRGRRLHSHDVDLILELDMLWIDAMRKGA